MWTQCHHERSEDVIGEGYREMIVGFADDVGQWEMLLGRDDEWFPSAGRYTIGDSEYSRQTRPSQRRIHTTRDRSPGVPATRQLWIYGGKSGSSFTLGCGRDPQRGELSKRLVRITDKLMLTYLKTPYPALQNLVLHWSPSMAPHGHPSPNRTARHQNGHF